MRFPLGVLRLVDLQTAWPFKSFAAPVTGCLTPAPLSCRSLVLRVTPRKHKLIRILTRAHWSHENQPTCRVNAGKHEPAQTHLDITWAALPTRLIRIPVEFRILWIIWSSTDPIPWLAWHTQESLVLRQSTGLISGWSLHSWAAAMQELWTTINTLQQINSAVGEAGWTFVRTSGHRHAERTLRMVMKADCCIASRRMCIGQKAARAEHTAKSDCMRVITTQYHQVAIVCIHRPKEEPLYQWDSWFSNFWANDNGEVHFSPFLSPKSNIQTLNCKTKGTRGKIRGSSTLAGLIPWKSAPNFRVIN